MFAARAEASVTVNDVAAVCAVDGQVLVAVERIVVVPLERLTSPPSSASVHRTGSEKVSVRVVEPPFPDAPVSVGTVVSGAVAVVVFERGATAVFEALAWSRMSVPPAVSRVTATNAPLGADDGRKTLAVVTALLKVELHSGMLSPPEAVVGLAATPLIVAVQSPSANATVRQTGSLKVTVATEPATVTEL